MAEGLFTASASSEAFESGYSDCGEESHNANNSEEFDEGESRRGAGRMLQFLIFDFEFLIGRRDRLMPNPDKNAGLGDKVDHAKAISTEYLQCQHKLTM